MYWRFSIAAVRESQYLCVVTVEATITIRNHFRTENLNGTNFL